ncbi:RGS domain-containing protein [Plasmodiophora brassicae]
MAAPMSTDTLVVGVWSAILAVTCGLWGIPAVLLWNRRHLEPIRSRRPHLLLAVAYFMLLLAVWVCVSTVFRDRISVAVNGFVNGFFLETVLETFTFFSFSLYVAYRRTLSQIKFDEDASGSNQRRWLRISTWLLKDSVAFAWVASQALILFAIEVAYVSDHPQLWHMTILDGTNDPTSNTYRNIAAYRSMVTAFLAIVVSVLLRGVSDAFGTVDMMKKTGLTGLIGLVIYAGFYRILGPISPLGIPQMISVLACNSALWFVMGRPLVDTYRASTSSASRKESSSKSDHILETFEEFLATTDGFAAFKAHLQTEFAVESLLFWAAVRKFQAEFTNDPNGVDAARSIYSDFLANNAPLQINLPSTSFRHFQNIFANADLAGNIEANMFDRASEQMVILMETNSLARFQKSKNGHVWTEFIENGGPMPIPLSDTTTDNVLMRAHAP